MNSIRNVLLLNPPGKRIYIRDYYCSKISKTNYVYEPVDLLMLSGILGGKYNLSVIDGIAEKLGETECIKRVLAKKPDAIIFLTGSISYKEDFDFIEKACNAIGQKIRVAATGDIFMEKGARLLKENRFLDAVLLDFTSSEVLGLLGGESDFETIISKQNDKIMEPKVKRQPGGEFSIGIPKHDLFPLPHYRFPFTKSLPVATVLTDYGCPYKCRFCVIGTLGFKWRKLNEVIAELKQLRSIGVKEVYFADQTFGANMQHTNMLLDAMIKEKIGLQWSCWSRVDVTGKELLEKMKKAGCHTIMYGVESGNSAILEKYNKGITKEMVMEKFALCRKLGIRTLATFMIGFPEETEASVMETISFSKEIGADYASFNTPVPRMGTGLRKDMLEAKEIEDGFDQFDQTGYEIERGTRKIPREKLAALRSRAVREFYLRTGYIMKRILSIGSLHEIRQGAMDFYWLLKSNRGA